MNNRTYSLREINILRLIIVNTAGIHVSDMFDTEFGFTVYDDSAT